MLPAMKSLLPSLALLWLLPAVSMAQVPAPPPPGAPAQPIAAVPKPATTRVALQTADGPIVLELETGRAPITTANFLRYVDAKKFDGTSFYRAVKIADNYGLIQGGTRNLPARTLKPIAHESTTKTGLSHTDGAIAMARDVPGTAAGDFFIVVGDMTSMDADPKASGDNQGFAVFGHVVEGMETVRRIMEAPKSATAGEGVMKGQMLDPTIAIASARRSAP